MRRTAALMILILGASAPPALAQSGEDRTVLTAPPTVTGFEMDQRTVRTAPRGPSLKSRIGRMFTGAVVGGWVGYFASHVAISDWESGTGITSYRGTWAAGGIALGAIAGRLMSGSGAQPPDLRPTLTSSRQVISRDEILESGATNALELVRSLRNEWLIPRGVNSFRESARGRAAEGEETIVVPGDASILVYLDNSVLGGTETLAEVTLDPIGLLEFIPAAEATYRWGTGHAHGVILLTMMGGQVESWQDRTPE